MRPDLESASAVENSRNELRMNRLVFGVCGFLFGIWIPVIINQFLH